MYCSSSVLTAPQALLIQWKQTAVTKLEDVLTLEDVKTWLNRPLEDNFWDQETARLIRVAVRAIEHHCQFTLCPATWAGTLPRFYDQFRITKRPLHNVVSLAYVDRTTGEMTTVDPSIYQVGTVSQQCGMITLGDGEMWPDAATRMDAVRIVVETGFYGMDGTTPELPPDIVHALSMTVAELDANRGDEGGSGPGSSTTVYAMKQVRGGYLNQSVRDLLAPYTYQSFTAV